MFFIIIYWLGYTIHDALDYRYCTCTGTVHMYRYIYEYCAVLCYQNFNYLKWRAITAVQVIRGDRKTPEVIQSVPVQYCVNFNPPPLR